MSVVSIESSIDRAKKLVRSKIRSMMDECKIRKFAMELHSGLSCYTARESGYREVLRMARKTISFLRPGQRAAAPTRGGTITSKGSRSLGALFFGLPVELQLEVVNKLCFFDLLSLRRTSQKFRELTMHNESHIVRHHIGQWVPLHITKLYPPPTDVPPTLGYLTDLAYKQRVSTHLALSLARQIVKEMMGGRQSRRMSKEATVYVLNQLRLGMAPLIFALFHFFETYRTRRLEHLWGNDDHDSSMAGLDPLSSLADKMRLQGDIISQYPDNLLLQVHQMYHLLLHLFMRRMSSPSPSVQRTLGCWTRQRPPNQAFAKVLILGGIKEVWHIYRIKGFCRRRKALDKYLRKLDAERTRPPKRKSRSKARATTSQQNKGSSIPPNLDITAPPHSDYNHPPPPPLSKLDVDDLTQLWTPAAEHRLIFGGIVGSLEEVRCCGQFVSQLLGGVIESDDEEDDADGDDSEDDSDDSADDEASPVLAPGGGNTVYSNTLLSADSSWDDELAEEDSGLFSDDEGLGLGSVLASV
ncbi:hypothetical protein HOY82DRAFT_91828 [Tuber indicum]|nr:hypothetical protein HOY82DRAFT_91828 [Tuber indicum]